MDPSSESRRLVVRGYLLEALTLAWNVVGVVVLAVASVAARSVALGGFALDSLIEILASCVVIWELSGSGARRRRRALFIIGVAFITLALYLAVQSTIVLVAGLHPRHSPLGIAWTGATALVMFALAWAKSDTGSRLANPVLVTESRVTLVDAVLASAVLVGVTLNAALDWWWADPLASYVILAYGVREGLGALRASRAEDDELA